MKGSACGIDLVKSGADWCFWCRLVSSWVPSKRMLVTALIDVVPLTPPVYSQLIIPERELIIIGRLVNLRGERAVELDIDDPAEKLLASLVEPYSLLLVLLPPARVPLPASPPT